MELVASLSRLENIVGLVWIDCSVSPSVLPAESPQLASIVFGGLVAKTPNVVPGARVNGDATEIINGVSMPKDNIAVSVCVLFSRVHSVAVSVDEREVSALIDSAD